MATGKMYRRDADSPPGFPIKPLPTDKPAPKPADHE
jgi:hypothetical protein